MAGGSRAVPPASGLACAVRSTHASRSTLHAIDSDLVEVEETDMTAMNETAEAPKTAPDLEQAARLAGHLREQIARALIGQDDVVEQILCALLAGGHVMIDGVPGVGKTLLARAFASAMESRFARIQFTPDLMPSDIACHALYDPTSEKFRIR